MNQHSVDCALLAAGSCIAACEARRRRPDTPRPESSPDPDPEPSREAVSGLHSPAQNAVAVVRPPGHHAECGCGMGFCLFSNVAVAAHHAIDALGLERVLVVDWVTFWLG